MSFLLTLGHVVALALLVYLWTYAVLHQGRPGSRSLLALFSLLIEWALSVFAEYLVPTDVKIWFRNLAQVGVFGLPAAVWSFAVSYTQRTGDARPWEKTVIAVLAVFGLVAALLTMTDGWHHWVRESVVFVTGPVGTELVVTSTRFGEALVSVVYLAGAAAFLRLLVFAIRDGRAQRFPFTIFLLAIFIPMSYALFLQLNTGSPGFKPPLSLALSASALLLAFGAYRLDFLGVTPIARNLVFDVLEEGIVVCAADGRVLDLNASARDLLLPSGGTFADAEQVLDQGQPDRREPPRAGETREGEFPLKGPLGTRILHLVSYPVARGSGAILGCVSVIRDVTQQRRQNAILVDKAERDGLTGLLNRATFVDRVERILMATPDQPALLVFDIDEFKGINDRFGHLGGDRTLQHVVSRVGATLRETDVFGRLGGDEFAVFLTGLDPARLVALAERIRAGVEESKLVFEDKSVDVAISVGFARGAQTFEQLYHKADQALYEAKRQGRNLVRGE
jgi:diguanylate cyclase (GGDEF)-like protein